MYGLSFVLRFLINIEFVCRSVSVQDGTGYTPSGKNYCYIVKDEDVGRSISCRCTITDAFDRESLPVFAETDAVVPG